MDNELARTSGPQALKDTLYQMAVALVHCWLWNLNSSFFEFTVHPKSIGMRPDAERVAGKVIKVRIWLEEESEA